MKSRIEPYKILIIILCIFHITACKTTLATNNVSKCENGSISISKDFESGAFASCNWLSSHEVVLDIEPENTPINSSPWYAFKLNNNSGQDLTLHLNYQNYGYKHRYWPKQSSDGKSWQKLSEDNVTVSRDQQLATLKLPQSKPSVWIAAQPIIDNQFYVEWQNQLQQENPSIKINTIGKTNLKHSLFELSSINNEENPYFVILGRQHPPEVTGAIAMLHFVKRLLQNDDLAVRFTQQFNLLVYPNINPDGVALGNWRHNVNGVDLNRDWLGFKEVETKQVIEAIEKRVSGQNLNAMLDFHSTKKDILYTQENDDYQCFKLFIPQWLEKTNQSQKEIHFLRQGSHNSTKATAKTYFFNTYNVPSTTFELDDKSKPESIEKASIAAAEQFMTWWLSSIR